MIRFAAFSFIAAVLQLVVPSYGLHLVRRFGTQNVGWFLVAAFTSLAFVHLLEPLRPHGGNPAVGLTLDAIYAFAAALLLIGMGHIETVFAERQRARHEADRLRSELKLLVEAESEAKQGLIANIARRDKTEKAIRESEAQYRSLFDDHPQPMWIFNLHTLQFLAVNKAALRQYGFNEQQFLSLKVSDLVDSSDAFVQDVGRPCQGIEGRGLWRHRRRGGDLIDVEITAMDLKYDNCPARLILANDISERRRHEQDLLEAQKLQTIGQLAGGAAHHLNNMLTIIDGHASLLLHKPHDATTTEQLKQISSAANRAAALTRQLLAVGGRHLMQKEEVDLNRLIRDRLQMLRRLVGDSVALQHSFASNLAPLQADPHLLEHIIVNLVLNARDAMPTGGTLTISTTASRVEAIQARRSAQGKTGDFLCLAIQDTGCGMSPEVQARVFEPFFTTRDIGKGTGLGLASVQGAVKQHSGWVEFTSEVGVGTEFRVFLPCARSEERAVCRSSEARPAGPRVRRETVLLVDPHDRVRSLARFVLDRHGYQVIEADTGPTALFLWEWQAGKIDVLLTDLKLSQDLTGLELAKKLCDAKPGLKVVYTCDDSLEGAAEAGMLTEGLRFVPKPFSPDRLVQTVEACLAT